MSKEAENTEKTPCAASAVDPLVKCPHCGSDKGYYQKVMVRQIFDFNFDGSHIEDNTVLSFKPYGKKKCIACDKGI